MSWNYRIDAIAGDDIAAAVMAKHTAHIARYPGVSQEHAIAATPAVAEAAKRAAEAAKGHKKGTALVVYVEGPDLYDPNDEGHGRAIGKDALSGKPEHPVKIGATVTARVAE